MYMAVVRPALMYRVETWALKKTQEKKCVVTKTTTMDVRSYEAGQDKKGKNEGQRKWGKSQRNPGKEVDVV